MVLMRSELPIRMRLATAEQSFTPSKSVTLCESNLCDMISISGDYLQFKLFAKHQQLVLSVSMLRTTAPLGCYIRKTLRFLYYGSLSTCWQNLEKEIEVTRKI